VARYEWDSGFVQACITRKLLDLATVEGGRFRPDEALTVGEFASFSVRGLTRSEEDVFSCFEKAREMGIVSAHAEPDELICRADCYVGLVKVVELLDNSGKNLPSDVEVHPVG
jgi:hypothetical protein